MGAVPTALAFVSVASAVTTVIALVLRKVEQTKRQEEKERHQHQLKEVAASFNLLHSGACHVLYSQAQPSNEELESYLMQGLPSAMARLSGAIKQAQEG